jgi:hypothetical protein
MSFMGDPFDPAAPSPDLSALHEEASIQAACYSLPYGAVGFSSHLITYYTMIVLILGLRPLCPWRRLEFPLSGFISGTISFIGTTIVTSVSISRCAGELPFRLIGAWMLMTSVAVSITTIATPYAFGISKQEVLTNKENRETYIRERKSYDVIAVARMADREAKFTVPEVELKMYVEDPARKAKRSLGKSALFWVVMIWIAGSIMGVYGVMLFCEGKWSSISTMNTVTIVFTILVFWPVYLIFFSLFRGGMSEDKFWMLIVIQLALVCSLGLLWMDWAIASMTGNLIGLPGHKDGAVNQKLAWLYFVLKRLPLLGL